MFQTFAIICKVAWGEWIGMLFKDFQKKAMQHLAAVNGTMLGVDMTMNTFKMEKIKHGKDLKWQCNQCTVGVPVSTMVLVLPVLCWSR